MYLDPMFTLKPGDIVSYMDLNGQKRQLKYISTPGLVRAIKGQGYAPQQRFYDEREALVHVPINAWELSNIFPMIIRKSDYDL